jgi:hypothetical protein
MSAKPTPSHLSRRERQILDILYQRGSAGVAEIQAGLPQTPSYSAVRALVRNYATAARVAASAEPAPARPTSPSADLADPAADSVSTGPIRWSWNPAANMSVAE